MRSGSTLPIPNQQRALVVCPRISPGGGPPGYTYNLMRGYEKLPPSSRIEIEFFGYLSEQRNNAASPKFSSYVDPAQSKPRLVIALKQRFGLFAHHILQRVGLLKRIIASDVVIVQGFQNPGVVTLARMCRRKVVYMPHSPTPRADEEVMLRGQPRSVAARRIVARMKRWESRLISNCDRVVFPSTNAMSGYKESYSQVLLPQRLVFIPSGVNRPTVLQNKSDEGKLELPSVLFVGRYVAHKGYDLFLSAAEQLRASGLGVRFFTLGGGPLAASSDTVEDLGWSEVPHDVIARCSLIVVPNRVAYYDLLPLESAALGKPLVMTLVGGNIDQQSLLPDSIGVAPEELVAGIRDGLERVEVDPTWGVRNAESFEQNFTDSVMARRWIDFLDELVGDTPSRR